MSWKSRASDLPFLWRLAQGSPNLIGWIGFGRFSSFIANLIPPKTPPVLILSLPRSGSSWVGEVLGSSSGALYLREPITQSNMQQRGADRAIISINTDHPASHLQAYANNAFSGLPDFRPGIVHNVEQWKLGARSKSRVVIKEVNPLAVGWFVLKFQPKIIFLVRHPVAVASSYRKLGWINPHLTDVKSSLSQINNAKQDWNSLFANTSDFWTSNGLMQGGCLLYALTVLSEYSDATVVNYENLCKDPVDQFRVLFNFADLTWNHKTESLIQQKASGPDQKGEYSTNRNTKAMANIWRGRVRVDEACRLREAYAQFNLPWYKHDRDWIGSSY